MAFCRFVFPLLVLSAVSCYASVPVYMWGALPKDLSRTSALETVTETEFRTIVEKELENRFVVVFIEPTLSVEDLSRRDNGVSPFTYLHSKVGGAGYLPSVQNPLDVLKVFADGSLNVIKLTENGLSGEIDPSSKVVFVNLKDVKDGESRSEYLRRHDEFMQKTIVQLQAEGDDVVAVYTAQSPSWTIPTTHSRTRRAASKMDYPGLNGVRLYATNILLNSKNESVPLTPLVSTSTNFGEGNMSAILVYENDTSISLNFNKKGGYWFFDSVTLTVQSLIENLQPVEEVFAIEGFSYRCAQYVRFASVNDSLDYVLTFENLKVQPFFENSNSTTPWGDSFNCVGFFSAPIWAGLFVTFIMLAITFYGIMMMMDIRTMDRFDDPKGKTITINAGE